MIKKEIILIGAGGHCRSCIDVIESDGKFKIAGIVVSSVADSIENVMGYPVLGTDNDLATLRENYKFALIAVGQIKSPGIRIKLFERLKELDFIMPVIVSPLSHCSVHAKVGAGTIVMHQSVINAGAIVGENCILNTK